VARTLFNFTAHCRTLLFCLDKTSVHLMGLCCPISFVKGYPFESGVFRGMMCSDTSMINKVYCFGIQFIGMVNHLCI
jgi:hypothetical protein